MNDFLRMLIPWANDWNIIISSAIIIFSIIAIVTYTKTKSRDVLNSMPGILTSLGLFGTFGAICSSLAGIATEPAEVMDKVGKSLDELQKLGVSSGDLDLKKIISDLIPAFSTSIYGLFGAILFTVFTKIRYAKEDAELEASLKFKEPERALESIYDKIEEQISTGKENNEKLTMSIAAQSEILSKFVDGFISEMQKTFEAMNTAIQKKVTDYGDTQFDQSRKILEGVTTKMTEEAMNLIKDHNDQIKALNDSALQYQKSQEEQLRLQSEASLEKMKELTEKTLELQQENMEKEFDIHSNLVTSMSNTIVQSTSEIVASIRNECEILAAAILRNVDSLKESYNFINEKSSSIISNYEQAAEAYKDAVQGAHDLNESTDKALVAIDNNLKSVGKTNENVARIARLVEDKESNMEAIIMRIEELGKTLITLQKLEAALTKITSK